MFIQKDKDAIFRIRCSEADEAYLMVGSPAAATQTIKMEPCDDGYWEARLRLNPGKYHYRFYTRINGSLVYQPPREDSAFWVDGWDAHCEVRPSATDAAPFGDAPPTGYLPPPKHLPPWAARVLSF